MVLPAWVNVPPLFVQSPARLWVNAPPTKVVPAPKVRFPPMVNPDTAVASAVPPNIKLPDIVVVPACNVFVPVPDNPRFTKLLPLTV